MGINVTVLSGRLTRDPELRYTQSGKAVLTLSLAWNTGYGDKQTPNFIDAVLWEKNAENAVKILTKGDLVLVEGFLKMQSWEEKNGNKRQKICINVTKWEKPVQRKEPGQSKEKPPPLFNETLPYDPETDIPF